MSLIKDKTIPYWVLYDKLSLYIWQLIVKLCLAKHLTYIIWPFNILASQSIDPQAITPNVLQGTIKKIFFPILNFYCVNGREAQPIS